MSWLLSYSVVISVMNGFLPAITKIARKALSKVEVSSEAKEEVLELNRELHSVSKFEELAKYIKLERKLNKLIEKYKEKAQMEVDAKLKLLTYFGYGIQMFLTIVSVIAFWLYRGTPIVTLPPEWLFPVDGILSWPTNTPGAVSFPVWFLICNTVAKCFVKSVCG